MSQIKHFKLRVTLRDISGPIVWREISVPANYTFNQFHRVLQIVFGWSDYHLYEFSDKCDYNDNGEFRITIPSEYDAEYDEKTYNSRRKKLSSVFPKRKTLTYIYDYGDSWNFEIVYEGSTTVADYPFAHCSDGGGATPPEDCGGAGGYEAMKQTFVNQDEGVTSFREWLGLKPNENWDANLFSSQVRRYINIALAYLHGSDE